MDKINNYSQTFHDDMHRLIFRDAGATRLGAVQTTIVWQFIINNYKKLAKDKCEEIISLQMEINQTVKKSHICNDAVTKLLIYIELIKT